MSLGTWKKEFYYRTAMDVAATGDVRLMLSHALHKWRGLRGDNLERHGLKHRRATQNSPREIYDQEGQAMEIWASSCALCEVYSKLAGPDEESCVDCPLTGVRGEACDIELEDESEDKAPFCQWVVQGEVEPMIRLLEKALEEWPKEPSSVVESEVECANCPWKGRYGEMAAPWPMVQDAVERLTEGDVVPAGECPECGAFCHRVDPQLDEKKAYLKALIRQQHAFRMALEDVLGTYARVPDERIAGEAVVRRILASGILPDPPPSEKGWFKALHRSFLSGEIELVGSLGTPAIEHAKLVEKRLANPLPLV